MFHRLEPPRSTGVLIASLVFAFGGIAYTATASAGRPARAAKTTRARSALARFLVMKGEEAGFSPFGRPKTIGVVSAFVSFDDGPKVDGASRADTERLRGEGFVSFTYESIKSASGPGTSNVFEFVSPAGARREQAYRLSLNLLPRGTHSGKVMHFAIGGVPRARGVIAPGLHVANVVWVEGRCEMTLGNAGLGPFIEAESAAAVAVYNRTNGRCP